MGLTEGCRGFKGLSDEWKDLAVNMWRDTPVGEGRIASIMRHLEGEGVSPADARAALPVLCLLIRTGLLVTTSSCEGVA